MTKHHPRHRRAALPEKALIPPPVTAAAAVAAAVLVALRLAGVIGWAWQWLLSPLWGLMAGVLLVVYAAVAAELLSGFPFSRNRKDAR
jgi:fatty acid desaturase